MSLLSVEDFSLAFPGTAEPVVKHISFAIEPGEMLALVGESGSGKSVTALSLLRLHPEGSVTYGSGRITFEGVETLSALESRLRELRGGRAGMIFQEPMTALNPLHTIGRQIRETLSLHQHLDKAEATERTHQLLGLVGLEKLRDRLGAYPHELSGGERQRVMIAMAVANNPSLLIADEPTTALDVTLQAQILILLKDLQARLGMAILLITHDLTLVRRFADRVAIMRHGEIVEQGATAAVFANPQDGYTKTLLESEPKGEAVPLPSETPTLLTGEDVSVRYVTRRAFFGKPLAETVALAPTSLTLAAGETLGLVGESGSGKTTLGLALTRLIRSSGRIVFDGVDISILRTRDLRPLRRRMQFVFQDPFSSLNPRMSVADTVAEGLTLHFPALSRAEREARVANILQEVGLDAAIRHRYPHEFSGGQRQRINIARAMILEPDLVILDEPTSALDLSLQAQILALLKELQTKRGTGYLFITHDLRVIRAIAHRVAVLQGGRIVEHGLTQAIFEAPQEAYTRRLIEASLHAEAR